MSQLRIQNICTLADEPGLEEPGSQEEPRSQAGRQPGRAQEEARESPGRAPGRARQPGRAQEERHLAMPLRPLRAL